MSEEYREQLLNYITDSVVETSQTTNPFREDFIEYQNDLQTYVTNQIQEQTGHYAEFGYTDYLQYEGNSCYLLYGFYWTSEHARVYQGFIVILDENLQPVQLITKFDTGTILRRFLDLGIDEEGRVYGVDEQNALSPDGQTETKTRRFILLNNILSSNLIDGTYKVTLRNSYNMQYNYFDVFSVYKKIGSADYMMVGDNENNSYKISVVTLKINVGSANEWAIYNSNYNFSGNIWSYLVWKEDIVNLKIITNQIVSSAVKYLELLFNGSSFSVKLNYKVRVMNQQSTTANLINRLIVKDNDEVYYQIGNYDIIIKNNYNTSSYDTIYYDESTTTSVYIMFSNVKNNIFIVRTYHIMDAQYHQHEFVKCGLIIGNDIYFSQEVETTSGIYSLFYDGLIIGKVSFNLVELNIQAGNYVILMPVDYNVLNYNGDEYNSYNMLKSNKMTLYNNNRLIFSRNLYNKTIIKNSTTSTVQVPNTMLNNIEITKENLYGETNIKINEENLSLTKNIYEIVFFNFTNTINVIDEDENKSYPATATYINENTNTGTQSNYEDTTISKARINYVDETSSIVNITWKKINKYNKITNFIVYADKVIKSIDFISNDESTIYITKEVETTQDNYYQIEQKIRTGNKAIYYPLYYQDEEVQYLSEPVYIIS